MNIADLAWVRDEDLAREPVGQASGAGARALMKSITAEVTAEAAADVTAEVMAERAFMRRRFRVRRRVGLVLVAACLAAVFVVRPPFGAATEYANAAVSLKSGGGFVEVAINDPGAEAAQFTEAFRAVGLNAEVRKAPVAPEDVGRLIGPVTDGDFPPGTGVTVRAESKGCASAWCGTVSMPVGFTGRLVFGIGRPAAPGERYASPVQVGFNRETGEHEGYQPRGKPVEKVRADLERSGMKLDYVVMWAHPGGSGEGYSVGPEHVGDDWIVESAHMTASDAVTIDVAAPGDVPENSLPRRTPPPTPDWWKD